MSTSSSPKIIWRKAAASHPNNNCVELMFHNGKIHLRHSKARDVVLVFTVAEWQAFVDGTKKGEFDDLAPESV